MEASQGNKYAAIAVQVTNKGDTSHHANPNNITLVDTNDQSYSYNPVTHDPTLQGQEFDAVVFVSGS
ncbi:MAG TPA: DUF4352 domain-containing protein [Syntrophomonadaceae bacterium]|nr:DUF4352 domain-containing protein [Syntrophomonadaceae bacterium]